VPRRFFVHLLIRKYADGASLIYTMPSVASPLQTLVHSSLGIQSLLKKQPLKHNVIDRDKVLVPPNWDSWGKIRVLREGFEVEEVNKGWSTDIEEAPMTQAHEIDGHTLNNSNIDGDTGGALVVYEDTIPNPAADSLQLRKTDMDGQGIDIKSLDAQAFLATQLEALERIRQVGDSTGPSGRREASNRTVTMTNLGMGEENSSVEEGRVNEHIGPVQFNMGGIQVDADDMLQRLKVKISM
jgi:dynein light intermediate chain 1